MYVLCNLFLFVFTFFYLTEISSVKFFTKIILLFLSIFYISKNITIFTYIFILFIYYFIFIQYTFYLNIKDSKHSTYFLTFFKSNKTHYYYRFNIKLFEFDYKKVP